LYILLIKSCKKLILRLFAIGKSSMAFIILFYVSTVNSSNKFKSAASLKNFKLKIFTKSDSKIDVILETNWALVSRVNFYKQGPVI